MNRAFGFILWLVFLTHGLRAENSLIQGGRSPDSRYEVRAVRTESEPTDYAIGIYTAKKAKPFFTLDNTGGYLRYPPGDDRCRAWWHPYSEFVAVTDQGTKATIEVYIVAVSAGRAQRLKIPDFIQNALGRVNATDTDYRCISMPIRWDGDDLLLTLSFSVSTPERGRLFYTSDVVLRLDQGTNMAPSVRLKYVSTPQPGNG